MLSDITYYELLGCSPDAATEEIKQCYTNKIYELTKQKVNDTENYRTAYYVLADPDRRKEYDDSIGLLHRNRIPLPKRLLLVAGRIIFTFLDIVTEFIRSFLIVIILAFGIYCYYFYIKHNYWSIHDVILSLDSIYIYCGSITILLSLIVNLFHPGIRRFNRKIKHALRKYK